MMVANANGRKSLSRRAGKVASILVLSIFCATYSQSVHAHEGHKHDRGAS